MPDRRSVEPRNQDEQSGGSVTALWLIPSERWAEHPDLLSQQERHWAKALAEARAQQFRRSRSWLRACLADHFRVPAQRVPLQAPPGAPPQLDRGWGHVSISDTGDALLLGWSSQAIGIDLERADRRFRAAAIGERFFYRGDQAAWTGFTVEERRREVLRQWIAKEAAIKWQRGSLAVDLPRWSWSGSQSHARHLDHGLTVQLRQLSVGRWWMAVAANALEAGQSPAVCLA